MVIHHNLSPADISCNTDGRKHFFLMLLQTIWVEPVCWFNNRTSSNPKEPRKRRRRSPETEWPVKRMTIYECGNSMNLRNSVNYVNLIWLLIKKMEILFTIWPSLHIGPTISDWKRHSRYSSSSGSGSSSGQRPNATRYNIKQLVTTHGLTSSWNLGDLRFF